MEYKYMSSKKFKLSFSSFSANFFLCIFDDLHGGNFFFKISKICQKKEKEMSYA